MATITAPLGVATAFAGGADVIRCDVGSLGRVTEGVQLQADGIVLEDCVLKVRLPGSTVWKTVTIAAGAGNSTLVGPGWKMAEIELSGVDAGSYSILFVP